MIWWILVFVFEFLYCDFLYSLEIEGVVLVILCFLLDKFFVLIRGWVVFVRVVEFFMIEWIVISLGRVLWFKVKLVDEMVVY